MTETFFYIAVLVLMGIAAWTDIRSYLIPNWISLTLTVLYGGFVLLTRPGWGITAAHMLIAALMLGLGLVAFTRGWMGGGDAKLLAAGSLWAGPDLILSFLMMTALWGGVLAIVIILLRRIPSEKVPECLKNLHNPQAGIPYGVGICAGAVTIFSSKISMIKDVGDFLPSFLTALTM